MRSHEQNKDRELTTRLGKMEIAVNYDNISAKCVGRRPRKRVSVRMKSEEGETTKTDNPLKEFCYEKWDDCWT